MILFPAIDLYNKECVRLEKGAFNTVTSFETNPLQVAQNYEKEGATWLHIIDLNGAENGQNINKDVIETIIKNTNLKIQVGGGIREKQQVIDYLNMGVSRVILGSYAIKNLKEVEDLISKNPNRIIVSVDSKKGLVTYSGWQEISTYNTLDFCKKLEAIGVKTIVYTDITKDGMMSGPNYQDYLLLQKETSLQIIASGGVSSYEDVKRLNKMNMYGAIVGKALYVKKVSVKEMLQCLQDESYLV